MSSATHSPSSMVAPPLFPQPEPCRQSRSSFPFAHRLATKRPAPDDDASPPASNVSQPRAPGAWEGAGTAAALPRSPVAKRFKPTTSKSPGLSVPPTGAAFAQPSPWAPAQTGSGQTGRKRGLDADLTASAQVSPEQVTAAKRPRVALKHPCGQGASYHASRVDGAKDGAIGRARGALAGDPQVEDAHREGFTRLPPTPRPFTNRSAWSSSAMDPRSLTIPPEPNLETGKIIDVDTGEVLDAAPLCTATARLPPAPIEAGPSLKTHWLATRSSNHQPLALTGTGNGRSPPHFTDADNSDRFELLVDWPTGTNSSCPNGHGSWSFRSHPTSATPTPAGSSWRFETPVLSLASTSTRNPQALVLYRPDHSQSLTDAMVPSGQLPSTIYHQSPSPSALSTPLLTSLAPLQPASESNGSPSSPEATAMDLD